MIPFVHKIYAFLIAPIRCSKTLNFLLFGFFPNTSKFGNFWDWTSLELKKQIKKYFNDDMSILDVGTGPYGVLSIYVERRLKGKSITGIDHLECFISNAMKQIPKSSISFIQSNLFEKIEGQYDLIVFNAPYIEKEFGTKLGVLKDEISTSRWSVGTGEATTIEMFIENVPQYLADNGTCLLGVNHFYLKHGSVIKMIKNRPKILLINYHKNIITKSAVYAIRRGQYAMP